MAIDNVNMRRRALGLGMLGAFGLGAVAGGRALAQSAGAGRVILRYAPSSPETTQYLLQVAQEAGQLEQLGLSLRTLPPAGPAEAMAGLLDGRWDFAHVGIVPLARQALEGGDGVLVATLVESHRYNMLMARSEFRGPEQLAGTRIGVVSTNGESGESVRRMTGSLRPAPVLVALGQPQAVFEALQSNRIDAGLLPLELAVAGRRGHGWTAFEGGPAGIPGGIATTRAFIRSRPDAVQAMVKGCVAAVHLFKTQAEKAATLLQALLKLDDREASRDLIRFHAPLLRAVPRPTLFSALPSLRETLAARYPQAARLAPDALLEHSFVENVEKSGYIRALYNDG